MSSSSYQDYKNRFKHIDYNKLVRRIDAQKLDDNKSFEPTTLQIPLSENEFDESHFQEPEGKYTDSQIEILLSIQEELSK